VTIEIIRLTWILIKSTGLWQSNLNCCVIASLKLLGSFPYREGAAKCFLNRNGLEYLNLYICVDA
jgi:hypothetical protein